MEEQKNSNLVYDVHDKPSIGQWIVLALQHVFAMFGATVLVPILVNQGIASAGVEGEALSIAVTLVTAGIGTLIYILCTKAKSPVFLGSSFAYIAPVIAAYIAGGLGGAMTGIMVIGLVYIIISLIIRKVGKGWLDKLLPPIVIGPMIMIIGLGLAGTAVGSIGIAEGTENIDWRGVLVALITFLVTSLAMVKGKGGLQVIPFLVGIVVGYIASVALGLVDFSAIGSASWFQVPNFKFPFVSYVPNFWIALAMAPVAIVTIAEHIGDHKALSTILGRDLLDDPGLENTLLGDGLATFVAGLLGGPSNTTYGENTAVVGMTKNASVWVIGMAACMAIILGFLGKFTAAVQTIPNAVLGGVSLLLYGFIAVNGLKVLIQNQVDFGKNKNIIVASSMLVLGLGGAVINFKTGNQIVVPLSGMSLAAIVGVVLNLLLPDETADVVAHAEGVVTKSGEVTSTDEKKDDSDVDKKDDDSKIEEEKKEEDKPESEKPGESIEGEDAPANTVAKISEELEGGYEEEKGEEYVEEADEKEVKETRYDEVVDVDDEEDEDDDDDEEKE